MKNHIHSNMTIPLMFFIHLFFIYLSTVETKTREFVGNCNLIDKMIIFLFSADYGNSARMNSELETYNGVIIIIIRAERLYRFCNKLRLFEIITIIMSCTTVLQHHDVTTCLQHRSTIANNQMRQLMCWKMESSDNIPLLPLKGAKSFVWHHSNKEGKITEADKK